MTLLEQIDADIKLAMKEKNKEKLVAIRAIKSELLLAKTSGSEKEFDESDGIKILQKLVKQRKDSAEIFKTQNRNELYEKEMVEVEFIQKYLPQQLSKDDLTAFLAKIIEETDAKTPKDMGKVMAVANPKLAGQADGKLVAQIVKELLNK